MRAALGILPALLVIAGCPDLDHFALAEGEVYRGVVVGVDDDACVPGEACSFIRRGFAEGAELEMEFDPAPDALTPGRVWVRDEVCGATLEGASLRVIEPLAHDELSLFDFPGGKRLRNYMLLVDAESGPLAGREAFAFVSLMRDDSVEVRLVAGSGARVCAPDDCAALASGACDFFGVFRLERGPRE